MTGFTKLWSEILSSSIWNEDDKVRIVWVTMLAAMPPDYVVRASVGGLAHMARVSREDCARALDVLASPDPDSRSTEFQGRRIRKVEGGFHILNGGKYREARSTDERKAYMAEYMKDYRKLRKQNVNNRKQNVNTVNRCKPPLAQAEAEAEAEADLQSPPTPRRAGELVLLPTGEKAAILQKWLAYRKQIGKSLKPASIAALEKKMAGTEAAWIEAVITTSIENGWQGLFWDKPAIGKANGHAPPQEAREGREQRAHNEMLDLLANVPHMKPESKMTDEELRLKFADT